MGSWANVSAADLSRLERVLAYVVQTVGLRLLSLESDRMSVRRKHINLPFDRAGLIERAGTTRPTLPWAFGCMLRSVTASFRARFIR